MTEFLDAITDLQKKKLKDILATAMWGRTKAKYEAAGLDLATVSSSPLFSQEITDAATFLADTVWDQVLVDFIEGMKRDAFIIDYLYEALGPANDDIYEMAVAAWDEQEDRVEE